MLTAFVLFLLLPCDHLLIVIVVYCAYTIFIYDLAISSKYILDRDLNGGFIDNVNRVLVIDCDVHQGDGTASFDLFPNEEKNMFTLSIHCESNYPRYKANSTYDIGLSDDMGDSEYLKILQESVNKAIRDIQPDFVFYDAGVDVYQHDVLGRLNISENGIRQRDRWVIEKCVKSGIPVVGVIGGGYDKDLVALGRRHAILHEEAAYVWRKYKMWTMSSTSTTLP
jgi:acetoin utilization deacetylase AcuC-like enzyme